jgi:hypothetical protein
LVDSIVLSPVFPHLLFVCGEVLHGRDLCGLIEESLDTTRSSIRIVDLQVLEDFHPELNGELHACGS